MAKSYSLDLRQRVMSDVDRGISIEDVARKYSVSRRVIFKWRDLRVETGTLTPRQGKTGPKPKLEPFRSQIEAAIESNPSITLEELKRQLQLPGCIQTLWHALGRWKIVLKKSYAGCRAAS